MSIFKSFIGNKDIKWWDGLTRTFTRLTSTGATLALNKIGSVVDILEVYGNGTNYTALTINDALANVSSNACTFIFQPGAWTIDANVTIPANVTLLIPKGAVLTVSNGITLTINSTIDAGSYVIFSGTGTIAGTPTLRVKDPTWFTGTETNNLYPSNPYTTWGSASPEGAITAPVGSIYMRTTAGVGATRYYKESGTGNTGWIDGAHIGANAIWHSGNDGTGSGLDADTVDGRNPGSPSGIATLNAASKVVQPALYSDTLYDGVTYRSANATPAANGVPVRDANKDLLDRNSQPIYGAMTGEESANSITTIVSLSQMNVTSGDRILINTYGAASDAGLTGIETYISWIGTATGKLFSTLSSGLGIDIQRSQGPGPGNTWVGTGLVIFQVTGNGTLTLSHVINATGGSPSYVNQIYAFFIKKQ